MSVGKPLTGIRRTDLDDVALAVEERPALLTARALGWMPGFAPIDP